MRACPPKMQPPLCLASAALLAGGVALAEEGAGIVLPSALRVVAHEILREAGAEAGEMPPLYRYRFIAKDPTALRGQDFEARQADLEHLCAHIALPHLQMQGVDTARIVISVADRVIPFGIPDPAATQFFEAFRLENAHCIWEEF